LPQAGFATGKQLIGSNAKQQHAVLQWGLLLVRCLLPTSAVLCMLQVRSLREELLAARRERAMTEAREAELRREIASLKRQVKPASECALDSAFHLAMLRIC
jgi:hypothetical protein